MHPSNTGTPDKSQQNQSASPKSGTKQATDENVTAAHQQAEADIEQDPDLNSEPDPAADLDEGEIARLDNGNDENLVI
jgi:hypothetical protein